MVYSSYYEFRYYTTTLPLDMIWSSLQRLVSKVSSSSTENLLSYRCCTGCEVCFYGGMLPLTSWRWYPVIRGLESAIVFPTYKLVYFQRVWSKNGTINARQHADIVQNNNSAAKSICRKSQNAQPQTTVRCRTVISPDLHGDRLNVSLPRDPPVARAQILWCFLGGVV